MGRFTERLPAPAEPGYETRLAAHLDTLKDRFAGFISGPAFLERSKQVQQSCSVTRQAYELPSPAGAYGYRVRDDAPKLVRRGPEWVLEGDDGAVPVPIGDHERIAWITGRSRFSEHDLAAAFPRLDEAERGRFPEQMTGHGLIEAV